MKKIKLLLIPFVASLLTGCSFGLVKVPSSSSSDSLSSDSSSLGDSSFESSSSSGENSSSSNQSSSQGDSSSNSSSSSSSSVSSSNSSSSEQTTSSSSDSSDSSSSSSSSSSDSSSEDPSAPALVSSEEYKTFWNETSSISFDVSFSNESLYALSRLQSHSTYSTQYDDYYFPCTVVIKVNSSTYTFEEVGARMKGNTSRNTVCNSEGQISGKCHFKFNFQETFDDDIYLNDSNFTSFYHDWSSDSAGRKVRKNRTFLDMEKIDVKWNKNEDSSKTKQVFADKLFRDEGVLAEHSTLGIVKVSTSSDSSSDTYTIIENIDSVFIKRNFPKAYADGDLYKCTYTNMGQASLGSEAISLSGSEYINTTLIGVEDNTTYYHPIYDLKTNKKKSTHADLINLIKVLNYDTSAASTFKSTLESLVNVDSFLTVEAVAYIAGNPDDMRNNTNNYYLYFDSVDHKATFIPYDFDRCFGIGKDWNPANYMMDTYPQTTKKKGCNNDWNNNPLYWRTFIQTTDTNAPSIASLEMVNDYYLSYKSKVIALCNGSSISTATFNNFVNSFPSSYRGVTSTPSTTDNLSYSEYITSKINVGLNNGWQKTA